MGIQATVKILDLLKAGCGCGIEGELHVADKDYPTEDGLERFLSLIVEFPNGDSYAFNLCEPSDTSVWTDVNSWGNNRGIILPLLKQYGIPFVEG